MTCSWLASSSASSILINSTVVLSALAIWWSGASSIFSGSDSARASAASRSRAAMAASSGASCALYAGACAVLSTVLPLCLCICSIGGPPVAGCQQEGRCPPEAALAVRLLTGTPARSAIGFAPRARDHPGGWPAHASTLAHTFWSVGEKCRQPVLDPATYVAFWGREAVGGPRPPPDQRYGTTSGLTIFVLCVSFLAA